MANRNLFATAASTPPKADTMNRAGGLAFALAPKAALAQLAVTGVFNDTFYADAATQLKEAQSLTSSVDSEFLAKLAVYARQKAFMKDLPAYLCASLATKDVAMLTRVFDRVIDNGKMLRNFVQIVRSGAVGRKSLGTRPKKLIGAWLNTASDAKLLSASVGASPSLADVIRLSHPSAVSEPRNAFFKHILGRDVEQSALPESVQDLLNFRSGESKQVPAVPFELLTSLTLSTADWTTITKNASWTQTRMNLNTFLRHGVLNSDKMVTLVANRLRNADEVAKARVFPYQLLSALLNINAAMPQAIVNALQDALELSLANVPSFECDVAVLVDTSGSMRNPVTGNRGSATSKVRYVDVAGLMASAVLHANRNALVLPFDTRVHQATLNSRDAVMTNASKLASYGGGGTNCGSALQELNKRKSMAKLVIYVSDNESWVGRSRHGSTPVMDEWLEYKRRVPNAKMVCIDISPSTTSQAKTGKDILNVGGFSDEVFNVIKLFAAGKLSGEHWVGEIEKIAI